MFENLANETRLYYLTVIVASIWFFNVAFKADISFVVAIIIAVAFIYYDTFTKENITLDLNTGLHYKLVSLLQKENLPAPEYFYIEPDMINFFYDISDFRIYNRDSYLNAIKSTDLMLKIKRELENDYRYVQQQKMSGWQSFGDLPKSKIESNIKNNKALFQTAEVAGKLAINYIHSFAVTLPGGVYSEKHKKSLEKFHILVKRVLDDILKSCKKSSTDPLIGQHYGLPRPHKPKTDSTESFNFVFDL